MKLALSFIIFCAVTLNAQVTSNVKTTELAEGLLAYTDYDAGLAFSKKEHKPVLVYFKDRRSANCRKFEQTILSDNKVKETLAENFVLICLLVDDNAQLATPRVSAKTGKNLKTIGEYHLDLEMSLFKSDLQPYSALLDKQNTFVKGFDYTSDPSVFLKFLKSVKF